MKGLEISSYYCREIYIGVTHVGATTKNTPLKTLCLRRKGRAQNVLELTEMLIIQLR